MMRRYPWSRGAVIGILAAAVTSLSPPTEARAARQKGTHVPHGTAHDHYRPLRIGIGTAATRRRPPGDLLCPRPGDVDATCRKVRGGSVALIQPPSPLQPLGSSTLRPPSVASPDPNQVFVPYTIDASGSIRPVHDPRMSAGWERGMESGFRVTPYLAIRPPAPVFGRR